MDMVAPMNAKTPREIIEPYYQDYLPDNRDDKGTLEKAEAEAMLQRVEAGIATARDEAIIDHWNQCKAREHKRHDQESTLAQHLATWYDEIEMEDAFEEMWDAIEQVPFGKPIDLFLCEFVVNGMTFAELAECVDSTPQEAREAFDKVMALHEQYLDEGATHYVEDDCIYEYNFTYLDEIDERTNINIRVKTK